MLMSEFIRILGRDSGSIIYYIWCPPCVFVLSWVCACFKLGVCLF